jgi:hypothetical protein
MPTTAHAFSSDSRAEVRVVAAPEGSSGSAVVST